MSGSGGDAPVVAGFRFAGVTAGIKKRGGPDLAVVIADEAVACAGVFTTNRVVAAPVVVSREHLGRTGRARAVVVNSGCANACTGERGEADARRTAALVAAALGCEAELVQVGSTGVIGAPLPMPQVEAGLPRALEAARADGLPEFARAIMTTDTRPKLRAATGRVGGVEVTVAGACKGAGMIHPDMATMLAYLVTDAAVSSEALAAIWRDVCRRSFNAITVDGDTSTNDTALVLASGRAGHAEITDAGSPDGVALTALLEAVAVELARDIVRDAEGGTKTVGVTVRGARSFDDALLAARAIATSPLVKTALHGEDPNWGRIVAAAGRSGCALEPERVSLHIGEVLVYERGRWQGPAAEAAAHEVMKTAEFGLTLDLGLGDARHTLYTSDFSVDYVRINADYRS